jgi:Heparinase II/III-like protein/Heparinase II/III N-terminus
MRTGALRRKMPAIGWDEQPLSSFLSDAALADEQSYLNYRRTQAPAFFFAPSSRAEYQPLFAAWDENTTTPVMLADELNEGRLRYFEHTIAQAGFPPNWHANPFTGARAPADIHWSEIGDFDNGDIKIIWEPSRFGFAYALVRAHWRTGDERYAEMFWRCVEDWREHNPPQLGVNWKCGQEISFRVMAWCFGLYGFLDAQATTAQRVASLAQMIAVSGARIEANLDYALSQHSNHGISEGVGLWTIGSLFPELRSAERWRETGRQVLEDLGRELIYDDGGFSQHSVNYHRVMLHDYVWVLRLGEVLNQPFSPELKERVSRAGELLYEIQDEASGRVPCYGQNDGALALPLSNCDYQDFRPVIQAVRYLSTQTRCYESGPWDEDLLWLFGTDAANSPVVPPERTDLQAGMGGYYTLRSEAGFAFVRCASFRHRPSQADMLHVDLWWRGQNIALDAGTYSYNAPEPWNNPLAHTAYHNTVTVDDVDQMDRAGRFLWLPWLHGRVRCFQQSAGGRLAYWEGEHDGYRRLKFPVNQQRGILRLPEDSWLILDRLMSSGDHSYRLHWLFPDVPHEWNEDEGRVTLHTPAGLYHGQVGLLTGRAVYSVVRADESSPRGWRAPYYNHREPGLSIDAAAQARSLSFWSVFGPGQYRAFIDGTSLRIESASWQASLQLAAGEEQPQISSVSLTGTLQDRLEIS